MNELIDWDAIRSSYWGGSENLDIKRKKQAEFLIAEDLPAYCVTGFVCYNEKAKIRLTSMGANDERIKIVPQAYY